MCHVKPFPGRARQDLLQLWLLPDRESVLHARGGQARRGEEEDLCPQPLGPVPIAVLLRATAAGKTIWYFLTHRQQDQSPYLMKIARYILCSL